MSGSETDTGWKRSLQVIIGMFLEDAAEIRGVVKVAPLEVIRTAKTPSRSTVPSSEELSETVSKPRLMPTCLGSPLISTTLPTRTLCLRNQTRRTYVDPLGIAGLKRFCRLSD